MKTLRFLSALLALISLGFSANAQTYRGAINGTVTDPSGAVVPEAQVKARAIFSTVRDLPTWISR